MDSKSHKLHFVPHYVKILSTEEDGTLNTEPAEDHLTATELTNQLEQRLGELKDIRSSIEKQKETASLIKLLKVIEGMGGAPPTERKADDLFKMLLNLADRLETTAAVASTFAGTLIMGMEHRIIKLKATDLLNLTLDKKDGD